MSTIRTFQDLQNYVNNNPLPDFECQPQYTMSNAEVENLDMVALHHIPNDAPRNVGPSKSKWSVIAFPEQLAIFYTRVKSTTWKLEPGLFMKRYTFTKST